MELDSVPVCARRAVFKRCFCSATHPDSHEAPKMPGVQDNYSIDVTNRFGFAGIDVDSGTDDAIENVDPFAVLNDLKQQAEIAKSLPKKKVGASHSLI